MDSLAMDRALAKHAGELAEENERLRRRLNKARNRRNRSLAGGDYIEREVRRLLDAKRRFLSGLRVQKAHLSGAALRRAEGRIVKLGAHLDGLAEALRIAEAAASHTEDPPK